MIINEKYFDYPNKFVCMLSLDNGFCFTGDSNESRAKAKQAALDNAKEMFPEI